MANAGMCTIAFSKKSVTAAMDLAARAGADAVEVWGQPGHIQYPLDGAQIHEVREHAESLALEICALGSQYHAGETVSYAGVKLDARNQVRIARELGAPLIRIRAGSLSRADQGEAYRRKVLDDIRVFADHAGDARLGVVLDRAEGTLLQGWDGAKEFLAEIDHENVALNYRMAVPADEVDLGERGGADYQALLPVSRHAHLSNHLAADDGSLRRCYLDAGIVDYRGLGALVRSGAYGGYFMVELLPELAEGSGEVEALRRDVDFIKSLR